VLSTVRVTRCYVVKYIQMSLKRDESYNFIFVLF